MANEIVNIIHDVAHRIGEAKMEEPYHHDTFLRVINRVYRMLNTELHCLEKSYNVAAATFSDSVNSINAPADMIRPFAFKDSNGDQMAITYVQPERFNASYNSLTCTIIGRTIYFSGVDEDSAFTMWYYSSGSTLVDKEDTDVDTGEANAPEWARHYWDILYYGAAIDMKTDYDLYKSDSVEFNRLKSDLRYSTQRKQHSVTPMIPGGFNVPSNRNDYDYPGLI